jgi:hypothetical protein
MTYQWLRNGTRISGATDPALDIPSVQFSDQAAYYVIVENDFGAVTSRVATLSVYLQPAIGSIADIYTEVLKPVVVSNSVTDGNSPPLNLSFSLGVGAPTNAVIDPVTGLFRWTPTRSQAPGTNTITVRVADETRPEVSNSTTFTVHVNDYLEATAGSLVMYAGESNSVPIDFFSSADLLELQCVLQFPAQHLGNLALEQLAPEVATVSLLMSDSNTATLAFTAATGMTLQGTQQLARLQFTTVSNQPSVFVPLTISSMAYTPAAAGLTPTLLANSGRITIIGAQGLLEARLTNNQRQLVLYGKPGVTYTIESRFGFGPGTAWVTRSSFAMTNSVRVVTAPSALAPLIFYRLRN